LKDLPQHDRLDRRAGQPPMTLPRHGLKVCRSIAIDRMVLATTTASAPAASAARATSAMSPVLGVSLTQSGSDVARRSCRTTFSVEAARIAKALPSSSIFGQEMLASIAATPGTLSSAARLAKPSAVGAEMLTTSGGVHGVKRQVSSMKCGTPLDGMPIALIRPPGDLDDARQRIAGAQFARDGLGHEGAEAVEVHHACRGPRRRCRMPA
jgi:hypothetical protein